MSAFGRKRTFSSTAVQSNNCKHLQFLQELKARIHEDFIMETQHLYRGRLIDHIQLVVADLAASRVFYSAIFDVLKIQRDSVTQHL